MDFHGGLFFFSFFLENIGNVKLVRGVFNIRGVNFVACVAKGGAFFLKVLTRERVVRVF